LSYRRRFPVVYLTVKAMRRPRLVSNQQRGLRFLYVWCEHIAEICIISF
jgi:hypothetical protein